MPDVKPFGDASAEPALKNLPALRKTAKGAARPSAPSLLAQGSRLGASTPAGRKSGTDTGTTPGSASRHPAALRRRASSGLGIDELSADDDVTAALVSMSAALDRVPALAGRWATQDASRAKERDETHVCAVVLVTLHDCYHHRNIHPFQARLFRVLDGYDRDDLDELISAAINTLQVQQH